nr:glycosyltransferase [Oceanococcus sp. HetDA_MAG_MS8]
MTLLDTQTAYAQSELGLHTIAPAQRKLRVAFFSDAMPERNGAGSYYTDLVAHLREAQVDARMFQPQRKSRWTRFALPLPGDSTQKLLTPNIPQIWQRCMQLQPDIIIAITPGPFGLLGMALAKRLNCGFACGFHTQFEELSKLYWNPMLRRVASGYLEATNRIICAASSTVMVHNTALIETVRKLGAPTVDVMGTPLAPCFVHSPLQPNTGELRRVCFAGRLAPEKNVDQILQAARAIPQLQFSIAGDGPLCKALEKQAAGLSNVRFHGWLDRTSLLQVIDASDMLLLPSALETFGTVALEAMARGRPALVAQGAGIHRWPELAVGLYTQQTGEDVCSALQRLLQLDPALRQARAQQARQAALQLHEATLDQWLQLLQSHAQPLT